MSTDIDTPLLHPPDLPGLQALSLFFPEELVGGDALGLNPPELPESTVLNWWEESLNRPEELPISVYVHVPFCRSRCVYCQYASDVPQSDGALDSYLDTLLAQCRRLRARLGGLDARNLYIGGGTPSLLGPVRIRRLFEEGLAPLIASYSEPVWSNVEVNPDSASREFLSELARAGIRRVSMGVQSLNRETLRWSERDRQTAEQVEEAVRLARQVQIPIVNLDLIAPLPAETEATFAATLGHLMSLGADTLTVYRFQPGARLRGKSDNPGFSFEQARQQARRLARERNWRLTEVHEALRLSQGNNDGEVNQYRHHSRLPGHLLGLGVYAESRLWGRGMYTTRFAESGEFTYLGLEQSAEDAARAWLARRISEGEPVELRDLISFFPPPLTELLTRQLERMEQEGVLRRDRDCFSSQELDRRERVSQARRIWSARQIMLALKDNGYPVAEAEARSLVAPFDSGEAHGGWRLETLERRGFVWLYGFRHRDGRTLALRLARRSPEESTPKTRRFDICFDGKMMPPQVKKFWGVLVVLIQRNDRRLAPYVNEAEFLQAMGDQTLQGDITQEEENPDGT